MQGWRTAHQCTDARHEFIHGKRLGQIVVGTRFESFYPIMQGVSSRQHQAGRSNRGGAQSPHEIKSIAVGQTTVDDEHRVRVVSDGKRRRVHPVENVSLDAGAE